MCSSLSYIYSHIPQVLNLPPDYHVGFDWFDWGSNTHLFLASQKCCLFSLSAVSPSDTDSSRPLQEISAFGRLWLMQEDSFTGHSCQVCPLSSLIAFCQEIFRFLGVCIIAWRWNSMIYWNLVTLPSHLPELFHSLSMDSRDNSLWLSPLSCSSCLCHLPVEQVMIHGVLKVFDNQEVTTENPVVFSIHRWSCSPHELLFVFSCLALLWSSYSLLNIPHKSVTALCCDDIHCTEWHLVTVQQVYLDQN